MIKSTKLRWAGYVASMEEVRISFTFLTGTPIGKIPLGRPRYTVDGKKILELILKK